jgi:hypothetical protein
VDKIEDTKLKVTSVELSHVCLVLLLQNWHIQSRNCEMPITFDSLCCKCKILTSVYFCKPYTAVSSHWMACSVVVYKLLCGISD